ncbi:MAG: hypothetical protein EA412_02120 [Chitinophagaceae bacterium]|nr:MAG: hypothetical protein EA412_02120 [Chitinophagaceae bacterium]
MSCKPDDKSGWDTDWLIPVFSTELGVREIAGDEYVQTDSDGLLRIVVSEEVLNFNLQDDLLQIPDTSLTYFFNLDSLLQGGKYAHGSYFSGNASTLFTVIDIQESTTYDLDGPEITFVRIKEGQITVEMSSTISDSLFFEYSLPAATDDNGNPLFLETVLPPPGASGTVSKSEIFDISGFNLNLKGPQNNQFNTFQQILKGKIRAQSPIGIIQPTDSLRITYKIQNIVPEYVKGYLGSDTISSDLEVLDTEVFDIVKSGKLFLEAAAINLRVENGFGIEGEVIVNKLKAIGRGQQVELSSAQLQQGLSISRALDNPFIVGKSNLNLDEQNSNLNLFLQTLPQTIEYDFDVLINPSMNLFNYQDFAYLNSELKVFMDLEIPLAIKLESLMLIDTIDFNPEEIARELRGLETGKLHLITDNSFPLDFSITVAFLNENGDVLKEYFKGMQAIGAEPGPDCKTEESKRSLLSAPLSKEDIEIWKNVEKAVVIATLNTPVSTFCNDNFVRLYDNNKLKVKLTADFKYNSGSLF